MNNEWAFDIGAGYSFSPAWMFSVFYEVRTALLDGEPDPMDLSFQLENRLTETVKLFGGVSVGLSDGSPDAGVTAGVSVKF